MKLKDIFEIQYGQRIYHSKGHIKDKIGKVPLISSKGRDRGVYGCFDIEPKYEHIITAPSTGTVCHAFYQKEKCCVDDNTLVFIPKIEMTEKEMIFYSLHIRTFKEKFMYGRQVTPQKIGEEKAFKKDEMPSWVYEIEIPDYSDVVEPKEDKVVELPSSDKWKEFLFETVFNMIRGRGGKATDAKNNPGNNFYIGASGENNGITQYTSLDTTEKGNAITVANNGSVGASFYQENDFLASSDVTVVTLKNKELNPFIALFLTTLIKQVGESFDYGRKWGITRMRESKISLPIDSNGNPDWQLMEEYIKSLPYSKYL